MRHPLTLGFVLVLLVAALGFWLGTLFEKSLVDRWYANHNVVKNICVLQPDTQASEEVFSDGSSYRCSQGGLLVGSARPYDQPPPFGGPWRKVGDHWKSGRECQTMDVRFDGMLMCDGTPLMGEGESVPKPIFSKGALAQNYRIMAWCHRRGVAYDWMLGTCADGRLP